MGGYFDWAATSPICDEALRAYAQTAVTYPGNPSAVHSAGRQAATCLKGLRERCASVLGCRPENLYFTSGGTESDSIVLNSALQVLSPGQIIISKSEHPAIRQYAPVLRRFGWQVTELPCPGGYASLKQLKQLLTPDTRFVFLMSVNNILGTIQDIEGAIGVCRDYSTTTGRPIHVHVDAVQAVGKIPVDFSNLKADSMAISAHKFMGPRGCGILINTDSSLSALSVGGGQESGLRPGTENLPAIAAMTAALQKAVAGLDESSRRATELNAYARKSLTEAGFEILSPADPNLGRCSPFILNVCSNAIPSEVLVRMLSDRGFFISAGSACNNNSRKKTPGLTELGFRPAQAATSVRISTGPLTTMQQMQELCSAMADCLKGF